MKHLITVRDAVTAFADWQEPTAAELEAIESEMPLILADVESLDVRIAVMDRPRNEVDDQRSRRALRRVLTVRRDLTNRAVETTGGAA